MNGKIDHENEGSARIINDYADRRFRREEHLKGRKEIKEVFEKGRQYYCKGAKLFVLKNNLPYNRICFTLSKASKGNRFSGAEINFKKAVARNRAKRLGREAYRLIKPRISGGCDLILLVYPGPKAVLSERTGQMEFLFSKAGLFK